MLWLVAIACSGGDPREIDPWAPPPLPEDLELPSEDILQLEELVGSSIEPAQVGDWIGQAGDAAELRRRLGAAELVPVRSMTLRGGAWTVESVNALAEARSLSSLEGLDAGGAALGPEGAAALARAPWLAGLQRLELDGAGIGDEGLAALCEAPDLRSIRVLDLADNDIGARGVACIGTGPFGKLEELDVSRNPLGDEGMRALAATARVDTLSALGVAEVGIGERGVFAIATSPYLAGLDRLDVRRNDLDEVQVGTLLGAFGDDAILAD